MNEDLAKALQPFGKRDLSRISANELLLAARYWASNTVVMSLADPWRSHLFALTFAAIIAPTAADLALWLRHAHQAVAGAGLRTSCYHQALLELTSKNPPWYAESELAVPGMPTIGEHRKAWSVELRISEMGRLLDEIKADGQLAVAPGGTIVL